MSSACRSSRCVRGRNHEDRLTGAHSPPSNLCKQPLFHREAWKVATFRAVLGDLFKRQWCAASPVEDGRGLVGENTPSEQKKDSIVKPIRGSTAISPPEPVVGRPRTARGLASAHAASLRRLPYGRTHRTSAVKARLQANALRLRLPCLLPFALTGSLLCTKKHEAK